jgi:hypothetical protein
MPCNYSMLYSTTEPVTVETGRPGITDYGYAAIRYFKMLLRLNAAPL